MHGSEEFSSPHSSRVHPVEDNVQNVEHSGKWEEHNKDVYSWEVDMLFHTSNVDSKNGNVEQTNKHKKHGLCY